MGWGTVLGARWAEAGQGSTLSENLWVAAPSCLRLFSRPCPCLTISSLFLWGSSGTVRSRRSLRSFGKILPDSGDHLRSKELSGRPRGPSRWRSLCLHTVRRHRDLSRHPVDEGRLGRGS